MEQEQERESVKARFDRWRSSKTFICIVVDIAVFLDAYLYSVIIPVLPFALTERIHLRPEQVQHWVGILVAAYGIGLLIGSPIVGYFADRAGSRRVPYLVGLVSLAASTVFISFATAAWALLLGRLIQGLSTASVHTVGSAIIADIFGSKEIGWAMGLMTTCLSLGMVTGPLIGGTLYHHLGYFAVFCSGYILIALDFILRVAMKERRKDPAKASSPEHDYGTFSATDLSAQQLPIPESEPPRSLRHPFFVLLSSPRMWTDILVDGVQSITLTCLETILPLHVKDVFKFNAQQVGVVFLVLTLPQLVGPLVGYVADRIGVKIIVSAGLICLLPLMVCLRFIDHKESAVMVALLILLFTIGLTLSMVMIPAWSDTTYFVEEMSRTEPGVFGENNAFAQAYSLLNMAYALGSALGPLIGAGLMQKLGWNGVTMVVGIICALCIPPAALFLGGRRPKEKSQHLEQ